MLRKMLLAAILIALTIALLGCNTVQGVGKDIEWVGQKSAEVLNGN